MNPIPFLTASLFLLTATTATWAATDLRLWWTKPAVKWEEANPIGNARLGAMIFGGVTNEHLSLNENTLYSGYPGHRDVRIKIAEEFSNITNLIAQRRFAEVDKLVTEKWLGAAQACFQPMGDLYLDFAHTAKATNYVREFDLATSTWRARYQADGVNFTREIFASHPDNAIVIRLTADKAGSLNFRVRLTSPHPTATTRAGGQSMMMFGQVPGFVLRRDLKTVESKKDTWKYPQVWNADGTRKPDGKTVIYDGKGLFFDARLKLASKGGKISAETNSLAVANADEVLLLLTAASNFNGYDKNPIHSGTNACPQATQALVAASKLSYADLYARHVRDYQNLFNRVSLDLGALTEQSKLPTDERIKKFISGEDPSFAATYFQFGRYLLISGSRPGGQPLNLQGMWNPHVIPPWAGAYTININTEMNYWPAEMANLSECAEPLLRMVRELSVDGARVARDMYGRRGWVAHHNTTLWREAQPVDGNAVASYWPMAAPWLCQHLFEHYQFTGDREFLRESYPVLKGAAEFLIDWLVPNAKGQFVTPVSTSPENAFSYVDADGKKQRGAVSQGCTADLALIRDLFGNTLRAAEILNTDAGFRTQLQATLGKLLPYQIGAHGRLQEWQEDFADAEPGHRHVSHLIALHPSAQITPRTTPELAAAVKRTLELRGDGGTGWSKAWKVNFWARLEDGDHAFKMLSELIAKSTMPNLFDTHPPFQIDGNFGGASGICEMLLQSHTGEIHLLPALPKAWPSGSVKGLRARGGGTVDISWQDGKVTAYRIATKDPVPVKVRVNGEVRTVTTEKF